jgi:hypothetical protein
MVRHRHAFRPTLAGAVLEDRVVPALIQVTPLSTLNLGSSFPFGGPSLSPSGVTGSTTVTNPGSTFNFSAGAFGVGVGFVSRYTSAYATNAGMGQGYGIFFGGATLLGSGSATMAILIGTPNLNPYGSSLGASASLATGPGLGGGGASGGESGVSPGPDPSGPQPTQVTPSPNGQAPITQPGPSQTIPTPSPAPSSAVPAPLPPPTPGPVLGSELPPAGSA